MSATHPAEPCGCCEGIHAETPATIDNRPGLGAIAYRSGVWAQFKASMLAALSKSPVLAGLRTRSDDDFTIALLDAWAVVCDILTFYQERIANEAYLRTATERVSVGELAKLIGYKLRPGLAASASLSFTLDAPPPAPSVPSVPSGSLPTPSVAPPPVPAGPSVPPVGSPPSIVIAKGFRAQTVPDPGARPATFETTSPISARASWNAIRPRTAFAPAAVAGNASANVRLASLVSTIRVGDSVLVTAAGTPQLNRVRAVEQDTTTRTTLVRFEPDADQIPAACPTTAGSAGPGAGLDDDFLWGSVKGSEWADQTQLVALATARGWSIDALESGINALRGKLPPDEEPPVSVYAMGIDASIFGHNATSWNALPSDTQNVVDDWEGLSLETIPFPGLPWVDLDGVYPVVVGAHVVLDDYACTTFFEFLPAFPGGATGPAITPIQICQRDVFPTTVEDVRVVTRNGYLMSSKVTSIALSGNPTSPSHFGLRTARVLVETAQLEVADVLVDTPVSAGPLMLDGAYLSLAVGQQVALTGERFHKRGEVASEVAAIAALQLIDGYTVVTLTPELTGKYVRSSVTIDANVAPATHGETATEILGSGDASLRFQRFPLKQPPLTYVTASTPTGSASTLVVRVDGVEWREVDWLYGWGPTDRVYTVIAGSDGSTCVQFGDGVTGARPGTGSNNIQAMYRHGTGSAGLARAGQISTLLSRPLGMKGVTNALPSSGAADPETIDQARRNAPITVKTIDRIVSLEDVGDFAAASAGIAKAGVSWIWDGSRYVACVTVAGPDGSPVVPGTPQFKNLLDAMLGHGDGTLPVTLCSYVPVTFTVAATITADPSLVPEDVLAGVKSALRAAFSFSARAFGQPVFSSEVIACVQGVPGVVAMTLDDFDYSGKPPGKPLEALVAHAPTLGAQGLIGAELVTLEPGPLPGVVVAG